MLRRGVTGITAGLIAFGASTAVAKADGLPVLGFEGGSTRGVVSIDGQSRYVAQASKRGTRIVRRAAHAGPPARGSIKGRFVVPVVAYDGSAGGLSANGRTLALIRPRVAFPQRSTTLAIVDAAALRLRSIVRLRGDFSFDAIAPTGEWIYLIQYTSPSDQTAYRVRALDVRTGRLLARPIVDPHDRGEAMRGSPATRATSADGRWAYTLYDGNGHPFLHALDTASRTARCLDLPRFPANSNPYSAHLRFADSGARLTVTTNRRMLAMIDTHTLAVSTPSHARRARPTQRTARESATTSPLPALGLAVVVVLLAAGGLARSVRARGLSWWR
jgi:hypothetical protein